MTCFGIPAELPMVNSINKWTCFFRFEWVLNMSAAQGWRVYLFLKGFRTENVSNGTIEQPYLYLRRFKTTVMWTFTFWNIRFPYTITSIISFTKTTTGFYIESTSCTFPTRISCFDCHLIGFVDFLWNPGYHPDWGYLHSVWGITNEIERHLLRFRIFHRKLISPFLSLEYLQWGCR